MKTMGRGGRSSGGMRYESNLDFKKLSKPPRRRKCSDQSRLNWDHDGLSTTIHRKRRSPPRHAFLAVMRRIEVCPDCIVEYRATFLLFSSRDRETELLAHSQVCSVRGSATTQTSSFERLTLYCL